MTTARVPTVFISSTCYDLQQMRADMKRFIEALGFHPVLSEYSTFPVNPDVAPIQNCLDAIRESADIFVLIVGGTYGSQDDSGKAVTNLEYLQAKAKGIPKYVFVKKAILEILRVWRMNPDGNYRGVVDSTRLFEFVSSLRNPSEGWVFPFETAQDIEECLRKQWAYLFTDCLRLRARTKQPALPHSLMQLTGEALRLVIERPCAWEYHLFSEMLEREIAVSRALKMDLVYGASVAGGRRLDTPQMIQWLQVKFDDLERLVSTMTTLFNTALPEGFGPVGIPGDPETIAYVAAKVGASYRAVIDWALEFRRVVVPASLARAVTLAGRMADGILGPVEAFSRNLARQMHELAANPPGPNEHREINLTLRLTMDDSLVEEFTRELDKAKHMLA